MILKSRHALSKVANVFFKTLTKKERDQWWGFLLTKKYNSYILKVKRRVIFIIRSKVKYDVKLRKTKPMNLSFLLNSLDSGRRQLCVLSCCFFCNICTLNIFFASEEHTPFALMTHRETRDRKNDNIVVIVAINGEELL